MGIKQMGIRVLFTSKTPKIKIIENDPDDDKFIECAIALKADAVITGDKEILSIKEYMGIRILTPEKFLAS
jgi:uncharacterized protein